MEFFEKSSQNMDAFGFFRPNISCGGKTICYKLLHIIKIVNDMKGNLQILQVLCV